MKWGSIGGPPNGRTVGIDFETTGLDPEGGDRIIQVGVAVFSYGELVDEWSETINPQGRAIAPGAAEVNGFTDAGLAEVGRTFEDVVGRLEQSTERAVVFAHRLPFEVRFWQAEYEHLGVRPPLRAGFCTKVLAGVVDLRGRDSFLFNACQKLGVHGFSEEDAHDALNDARACAQLGNRIVDMLGGWDTAWFKHDAFIHSPITMSDLMRLGPHDRRIYRAAIEAGAKMRRQQEDQAEREGLSLSA